MLFIRRRCAQYLFGLFVSAASLLPSYAQDLSSQSTSAVNRSYLGLIAEVDRGQSMMRNLEEMCDGIGPRLTGSKQLRDAQQWAMLKLKEYGATNVHEEVYEMGKPWIRGKSAARLLNANQQEINMVQQAWTTSSSGKIRADVESLNVHTLEEMRAVIPKLKGKIVLALSLPRPSAEQKKDLKQYTNEYNAIIKEANMAAVLFISERDGSLLDMHGSPNARFKHNVGIINKEQANLLQRLMARGVRPKMELEFGGKFGSKPALAYNVVADIRGSELPDEMVIIGVHQDSWDLATGATDNGVGVVLAMEVLRSIQAAKLPIKRSLRIVLFSGEEQGLMGSKAYVQQHVAELPRVQAMLTVDSGAGRIIGVPDMQVDAWYTALSEITAKTEGLAHLDVVYAISKGSDQESFFVKGIPAFSAIQEPLDYLSQTWHSNVDTLDHVKPEYLAHNAKILSLLSFALLNAAKLPHQVPPTSH